MKIRPVGRGVPRGRTDRRTDITKIVVVFRNFANVPNKRHILTLFKNPTHALCFKIHTKTQSLFKTLECLRLLCHTTCFGPILDHLQRMFLVQCYFPPCCFVTILLGYVTVSSICVVVMCTSLLSVLLCMI